MVRTGSQPIATQLTVIQANSTLGPCENLAPNEGK